MTGRVGVFGATGYIGSAIKVAVEGRRAHVEPLKTPRCSSIDLAEVRRAALAADAATSALAARLRGMDAVVNASGIAEAASADQGALAAANALVAAIIAIAAQAAGVPRLIHLSSAAVQGRTPTLDDAITVQPCSPYGRSKAAGEALVLEFGPRETVVFRPPGVHSHDRKITQQLIRFAQSPLSMVASPGSQNTPQVQRVNVADAAAFLALTTMSPPPIVHMASERIGTAQLLEMLGQRRPTLVPIGIARSILGLARLAGHLHPTISAVSRRAEVLWVGQHQAGSWLECVGWYPPTGREGWQAMPLASEGYKRRAHDHRPPARKL